MGVHILEVSCHKALKGEIATERQSAGLWMLEDQGWGRLAHERLYTGVLSAAQQRCWHADPVGTHMHRTQTRFPALRVSSRL